MRVAIIGAGLSGLACAHELQRSGITPDIFEKKDKLGDVFPHVSALLQVDKKDPLVNLREQFFININPLIEMTELKISSSKESVSLQGNQGYLILRGQDQFSLENQIGDTLTTKINFSTYAEIEELVDRYDVIIVATGDANIAKSLNLWSKISDILVRGGVIIGNFDKQRAKIWANTNYAKKGYAYEYAFDEKSACRALVLPDTPYAEADSYWHQFWQEEHFDNKIVQVFQLNYQVGYVYPHKYNNLYFIGKAGGFVNPLMPDDITYSIASGVTAARCIAQNLDYEQEIQPFITKFMKVEEARKTINTFEDKDYDKLVDLLGLPGMKNLILSGNLNIVTSGSSVFGAFGKLAAKKFFSGNENQ